MVGVLAEPNPSRTDGPLATLERAAARFGAFKQAGPLPAGGVEVVVRRGRWAFTGQAFRLGRRIPAGRLARRLPCRRG